MMILLMALSLFAAPMAQDSALIGTWKYIGYNYQGHESPAPNPDLDLRFTFDQQQTSLLTWFHNGESDFCQRLATYEIRNDGWLYQKTVWVNPKNEIFCTKDPEMKLGNESLTHYRIENNRLNFDLELGGQPFVYILSRWPEN
jgi:hypothetical protein